MADMALLPGAVEEMLRWSTPSSCKRRTATRLCSLGGHSIEAGDKVLIWEASANRDESVFGPDADQFRIDRHPNPHLSFGLGPHFCLGAALARIEARVVLGELLDRFSSVEVAGEVTRTASPVIAGVRQAPLVFRLGARLRL